MDVSSFEVPPSLRQLLLPVLQRKCLRNDQLWQSQILPQLLSLFDNIGTSLSNRGVTDDALSSHIQSTIAKIVKRLSSGFSEAAPFTIHRLSELLLSPENSGYHVLSPKQMLKYVQAILRVVSVSSSESRYLQHPTVSPSPSVSLHKSQVPQEVYALHDLPTNICFVPLDWGSKQIKHNINDDDSEDNNKKRSKLDHLGTTAASDPNGPLATSSKSLSKNSLQQIDAVGMTKLTSHSSLHGEVIGSAAHQDELTNGVCLSHGIGSEKLADANDGKNFSAQLLSSLNTEQSVEGEPSSSAYEDGSISHGTHSKKHKEELLA